MPTNIDINFIAKQMQRVLSEMQIVRSGIDIMRREQQRMADDISMIKTDQQGMRADITNMRHEMRDGFAAIDARLRPLEDK